LYKATGDAGYLKDAEAFYERSRTTEKFTNPNPDRLSYENVVPALHLMLYQVRSSRARMLPCEAYIYPTYMRTRVPNMSLLVLSCLKHVTNNFTDVCLTDVLLTQATKDTAYKSAIQSFVATWLASNNRASSSAEAEDFVGVAYTPMGLAKAQPGGTLQHTANAAFLVMAAVDDGSLFEANKFMRHACWVRNQIGYMLVSGPQ
jgi:hypothetical protein